MKAYPSIGEPVSFAKVTKFLANLILRDISPLFLHTFPIKFLSPLLREGLVAVVHVGAIGLAHWDQVLTGGILG